MTQHYDPHNYSSQDSLGYLLKINHSLMHDCGERIFATHDISFVQWLVLIKVKDGSAQTASDLCRKMFHDNGAITRMLDQLEERGLIERQRNIQDRRVVNLKITEAGLNKLSYLTPAVINNLNAALESFSTEEFAQLIGLLQKLKNSLQQRTEALAATPTQESL